MLSSTRTSALARRSTAGPDNAGRGKRRSGKETKRTAAPQDGANSAMRR